MWNLSESKDCKSQASLYGWHFTEALLNLVAVDLYRPLPKGWSDVFYLFAMLHMFFKYIKLNKIIKVTTKILIKKC